MIGSLVESALLLGRSAPSPQCIGYRHVSRCQIQFEEVLYTSPPSLKVLLQSQCTTHYPAPKRK